jgi:Na+-driven multidrug efflux pump
MLIGAGINFVANPIFIFGLNLGVVGSALATVISQIITTVWTIAYFTKGKSLLKLKKKSMNLDKAILKQIVAIGMSAFVMQMAASLVTLTFNKSLGQYGGDVAIGAMALVTSIAMLILMPMFGISQGAQPIIGYNYGAKDYDRVKKALKYAMIGATAITTTGFIIVELFPVQIITMFNKTDANLISIGSKGLAIFHMVFPIVGVAIVGTQYFTSVGKAKLSMFLGLLRQVLILIPLILILPKFYGVDGVWIAQPVADVITTIVTVAAIMVEMKKLNNNEEQNSDALENIV